MRHRVAPIGVVVNDDIENGKQFSHAGGDGNLEGFSGVEESLVHGFDWGIESGRIERSHIEGTAHISTSAPGSPSSSVCAAISVKRSEASQGSNLPSVEASQFGEFSDQNTAGVRSDAWNRL